ncbi:flagellar biosynthesis anti-sigma factor FlgM [Fuchsiella alkaliacetigena]|uniref:flagellar biosynthesis anti-sigma factor FlgM n=1 Tax=Fuchsiella alkaliacetigena TaxID=957042 RepID=UPI00200AC1F6|nr:flagellar biosynthesis anti-sigma factor FlgM [Fuchsiella alkaliacetigena]MCK8824170.1 flagellar biosynthesis anti-sigma factor FlgM [Fuchsiella alkaliacetigena]
MKISSEQLGEVLQAYGQQQRQNETGTEKKDKSDKLSLSTEMKEIQLAKENLANKEPVRQEKVDSLKQAIQSGNYNVSGEEVAEKMLERVIVDQLV